ncbi:hypothetical protein PMIN01_02772 [Paraphaeosphaeria minitans]|uniref:Uncharacterized protein n=1 Tax=Paraphaeosphaeria minitans TaxID=565426 RepID=A0A9P6KV80_9PLEO|nr:hypothetical protein PMIN01_02772 [Paraphaeosphaeria minitans]
MPASAVFVTRQHPPFPPTGGIVCNASKKKYPQAGQTPNHIQRSHQKNRQASLNSVHQNPS